jgi:hypothetical protein
MKNVQNEIISLNENIEKLLQEKIKIQNKEFNLEESVLRVKDRYYQINLFDGKYQSTITVNNYDSLLKKYDDCKKDGSVIFSVEEIMVIGSKINLD